MLHFGTISLVLKDERRGSRICLETCLPRAYSRQIVPQCFLSNFLFLFKTPLGARHSRGGQSTAQLRRLWPQLIELYSVKLTRLDKSKEE